jgi:hypothetical protein
VASPAEDAIASRRRDIRLLQSALMVLWNAAGIWRDVAARHRVRRTISGEAGDTTIVQGKSQMKHDRDGEPLPSVDDPADAETVALPKTGDLRER